jgi:hypothetical protein
LKKEVIAKVKDSIEGKQQIVKYGIRITLDKKAPKFGTDIEWEKSREE